MLLLVLCLTHTQKESLRACSSSQYTQELSQRHTAEDQILWPALTRHLSLQAPGPHTHKHTLAHKSKPDFFFLSIAYFTFTTNDSFYWSHPKDLEISLWSRREQHVHHQLLTLVKRQAQLWTHIQHNISNSQINYQLSVESSQYHLCSWWWCITFGTQSREFLMVAEFKQRYVL